MKHATAVLVALSSLTIMPQVTAAALAEVDLASDTAWTLRVDGGDTRPIKVPGGGWSSEIQEPLIDRGRDVKDHVVYERKVTIPKIQSDQVTMLKFGAVNYGAEVYINDNLVGEHHGPLMPFEVDITEHAKPGEAVALKVVAYSRKHYEVIPSSDKNRKHKGCIVPIGFDYQKGVEPLYLHFNSKFAYVSVRSTTPVASVF